MNCKHLALAWLAGASAALHAGSALAFPVLLDELPTTTPLAALPTDVPRSIPAKEHAPGAHIKAMPTYDGANYSGVSLYRSAEEMAAFDSGVPLDEANKPPQICFFAAHPTSTAEAEKTRGWETNGEQALQMVAYPGYRNVGAVRAERFIEGEGKGWIEVNDFWVDAKSKGSRQFATGRLEFTEIARPYDGVVVYAAKTSAKEVEVVVRVAPSKKQKELFAQLGEQASEALQQANFSDSSITVNNPNFAFRSNCGHQRVRLQINDAASTAAGEPANAASTVSFRKARVIRLMEEAAPPQPQAQPTSFSLTLIPITNWQLGGVGDDKRFGRLQSIETRQMAINIGLSKMSSDESAVLSLSYRWMGDPLRSQVVSPDKDAPMNDQIVPIDG